MAVHVQRAAARDVCQVHKQKGRQVAVSTAEGGRGLAAEHQLRLKLARNQLGKVDHHCRDAGRKVSRLGFQDAPVDVLKKC